MPFIDSPMINSMLNGLPGSGLKQGKTLFTDEEPFTGLLEVTAVAVCIKI